MAIKPKLAIAAIAATIGNFTVVVLSGPSASAQMAHLALLFRKYQLTTCSLAVIVEIELVVRSPVIVAITISASVIPIAPAVVITVVAASVVAILEAPVIAFAPSVIIAIEIAMVVAILETPVIAVAPSVIIAIAVITVIPSVPVIAVVREIRSAVVTIGTGRRSASDGYR